MTGKIYFVAAPGRIKIGWTTQPERRFQQLQAADMEKLSVLAVVDGPRALEHHLHTLAGHHLVLRREWFRDCEEIRDLMKRVVAGLIKVDAPVEPEGLPEDSAEYFDLKRLPILEARAAASRLYREFLEEIHEAIAMRREDGRSCDDLLEVMRKIDPDVIAAKYRAVA